MGVEPTVQLEVLEQIESPELRKTLERLGRTMAERAKQEKETKTDEPKGQLILFPQWADTRRATASAVFRSALFPALGRGKRQFLKNKKIFSTRGVDIFFTGEQFDQSDLDVYLEILHLLKDQPSGTDCTFTAYGLLKAIGRSTGNKDHQWLHSVLIRLTACAVDMTDHKKRYFGSLLDGGIKDEITKHYTISVNPQFAELFKRSWSLVLTDFVVEEIVKNRSGMEVRKSATLWSDEQHRGKEASPIPWDETYLRAVYE